MPALDVPQLKKRIGRRELAPIHLFVGEDVRLVDRIVDDVEATIDEADRPFAVERIYAGEPGGSPLEIADAARVFPMLGNRRIVIVLRAERFLKPRRAARAGEGGGAVESVESDDEAVADLGPLEDYFVSPVPSTTVVFVATEVDKTRRLTKKLLQIAEVTDFTGLGTGGPPGRPHARAAAIEWAKQEFSRIGRGIQSSAIELLADRAGGDITKLRGDVERLLIYAEGRSDITREDVAEVAAIATEIDDWAIINAIADGDAARALREVAARIDRGDSPHQMLGQLRWWVSGQLAQAAPDRVPSALDALLRTDLALKSSAGDDGVLLERLVVDLVGRPVPKPAWGRRG